MLDEWKTTPFCQRAPTIPKDAFPSPLTKLLKHLQENGPANLRAGFSKAGIFQLDSHKYKVLSRLPSANSFDVKYAIGDSFLKHLQKTRNEDTQTIRQKKQMHSVEPGQSISEYDLVPAGPSSTNGPGSQPRRCR